MFLMNQLKAPLTNFAQLIKKKSHTYIAKI